MNNLGVTLWSGSATDDKGTVTVRVTACDGRLGLTLQEGKEIHGLSLDRYDGQLLRHAITAWLVGQAP